MANKKVSTETGRWNKHKFTVSPKLIRGFSGLQIEGSCETEEKNKNKQHYAARKNGNPSELSMTVHLSALTGCDVRKEALAFVSEAAAGKSDYFYIGTKKLVTYKLLLQKASVSEVEIAHNHTWVRADVQLTFVQTGTGGTSVSSSSSSSSSSKSSGTYSSSGSAKQSVKTTSTTTKKTNVAQIVKNVATSVVKGAATAVATAAKVSSAVGTISKIVSSAKKYTATKKTTTAKSTVTKKTTTKYTTVKALIK